MKLCNMADRQTDSTSANKTFDSRRQVLKSPLVQLAVINKLHGVTAQATEFFFLNYYRENVQVHKLN